ncbi:MAG: iron(III) transport system permease protein [Cyclobacteriaceae bacterium]
MEISAFKDLKNKNIGWLLIAMIGSFLLIGPLAMVLTKTVGINFHNISTLSNTVLPSYIANTLWISGGVIVLSLFLGVSCAWAVTMYQFPFRKQLEWLLILPLAIPSFINGIAYAGLTDYAGPIRIALRATPWLNDVYIDIMNAWGAIFVMSLVLYPYVYLTSRSAFANQSSQLLEASKLLGASELQSFYKVAFPLAWPAIFSGLSLVIMEVLNDYGTVKYFGIPTFTTGIFKSWLSLGDMPSAIFLAFILLSLVVIILSIEWWITRKRITSNSSFSRRIHKEKLVGPKKYIVLTFIFGVLTFAFIVPLFQLLWWLNLSFHNTDWSKFLIIIGNTLKLSLYSSILIIVLGVFMAYAFRIIKKQKLISSLSKLSSLGYAMPGAVVAIGIIATILLINSELIYAGIYALLFGYTVRFFAVGYNPIVAGFKKNSSSLDDAAVTLGLTRLGSLFSVHLPLIKRSLLVSLILIFVDISKELPITLILRPFNFNTLSTNAYQFATDEMAPESSAASLFIILVGIIPIYILNRSMRSK